MRPGFVSRGRVLLPLVACAAPLGCSSPSEPPPPPGGGAEFVLDFDRFRDEVAPVLVEYGCHAAQCHGGGIRGTYELSPTGADFEFDFEQSALQVNPYDPDASPILTRPLAGAAPHAHEPFADPSHPGYVAIREWIAAGEFR
jgi:hypothetical protein